MTSTEPSRPRPNVVDTSDDAAAARPLDRRRRTAFLSIMGDKTRRALLFTMVGIPAALLMVAWKAALFVVAPSLFLFATVLFNLGVAVAKAGIIRSHVGLRRREVALETVDAGTTHRRTYRKTGILVTSMSAFYTLSFIPMFLRESHEIHYERNVAVIIAAATFVEIGLAVHGSISARRNSDVLTEAVKLTNLASGLVLLTLTQSALLSLEPDADIGDANAISGIVFGSLATGVGGWMLWRSRASAA